MFRKRKFAAICRLIIPFSTGTVGKLQIYHDGFVEHREVFNDVLEAFWRDVTFCNFSSINEGNR